jgi:hypothetical protein
MRIGKGNRSARRKAAPFDFVHHKSQMKIYGSWAVAVGPNKAASTAVLGFEPPPATRHISVTLLAQGPLV